MAKVHGQTHATMLSRFIHSSMAVHVTTSLVVTLPKSTADIFNPSTFHCLPLCPLLHLFPISVSECACLCFLFCESPRLVHARLQEVPTYDGRISCDPPTLHEFTILSQRTCERLLLDPIRASSAPHPLMTTKILLLLLSTFAVIAVVFWLLPVKRNWKRDTIIAADISQHHSMSVTALREQTITKHLQFNDGCISQSVLGN